MLWNVNQERVLSCFLFCVSVYVFVISCAGTVNVSNVCFLNSNIWLAWIWLKLQTNNWAAFLWTGHIFNTYMFLTSFQISVLVQLPQNAGITWPFIMSQYRLTTVTVSHFAASSGWKMPLSFQFLAFLFLYVFLFTPVWSCWWPLLSCLSVCVSQRGRLVARSLPDDGRERLHPQQLRGSVRLHPSRRVHSPLLVSPSACSALVCSVVGLIFDSSPLPNEKPSGQ